MSDASCEMPKRRRLLSEIEAPLSPQPNACSVEDVLQLLQLLYAVSKDSSMDSNLLGACCCCSPESEPSSLVNISADVWFRMVDARILMD